MKNSENQQSFTFFLGLVLGIIFTGLVPNIAFFVAMIFFIFYLIWLVWQAIIEYL
jgi:apolipoprotein N-acyltransferase